MMRTSSPRLARRRLTLLLLAVLGPVLIGCEAILDFDRTPLQPVPDASMEDSSTSTGTDPGKKKDTGTSGDDDDDDDGKPDAGKDAGKDAGEDSGDAGDGGRQ
jgi:hypothetical protein